MRGGVGVCPVASVHPAAASSANSRQGPSSGMLRAGPGGSGPSPPAPSSSCLCPTVRKVKCPPGLAVSEDERLWCELIPGLRREAAHGLCTTVSVLGSVLPSGSCSDATSGGTNVARVGSKDPAVFSLRLSWRLRDGRSVHTLHKSATRLPPLQSCSCNVCTCGWSGFQGGEGQRGNLLCRNDFGPLRA